MRYSKLFGKSLRQPPKEADTVNHKLLTQAGFVDQLMAGVYTYLPLGLKVLRKVEAVVREEMDIIGGQEVLMPVLHPKAIWETTGGWNSIDVLFKIKSQTGKDYALGQSEEEVVTPLTLSRVNSYKDLPLSVYQIHWKFRDELRAKSGIMRGREFFMKDMYSFHESNDNFLEFYGIVKKSYLKIFDRLGLSAKVTEASGGAFSKKISYEFMVLTDAGEDEILYCSKCDFCINLEIAEMKVGEKCHRCGEAKLEQGTAAEVGNVFDLGTKYGEDFDLGYLDASGKKQFPVMGCYGIGISRIMGVIVEKYHDDKGIIWPEAAAPFRVHLIGLDLEEESVKREAESVKREAERVYQLLQSDGIEVLFDDRLDASAGQKFADADLIGIPYRVVISKRTEGKLEVKRRSESNFDFMSVENLILRLTR